MSRQPDDIYPTNESRGSGTSCVATCLIVFGVCALLLALSAVIGGFWVYRNFRSLASDAATGAMNAIVDESEMSEEAKAELKTQIERVSTAYQAGEIDNAQIQEIFESLVNSPLMTIVVLQEAEARYLAQSGLDDDEQAAARRTMDRIARGLYDETISPEQLEPALDPIVDKASPDGERTMKAPGVVTDEELRELLSNLEQLAAEHEIPDEPFEIDVPSEFRRHVDEVLRPADGSP